MCMTSTVFIKFVHCKVTLLSCVHIPCSILLKSSHSVQPTLQAREEVVKVSLLVVGVGWGQWERVLALYHYGLLYIYFILWVIQHYIIYFVAQVVLTLPPGALLGCFLCPFNFIIYFECVLVWRHHILCFPPLPLYLKNLFIYFR